MKDTTLSPPIENKDDAASYEAQVDYYMAEVKKLQQQMADDRQEILHMQAETRAILDDVMATLRAA
jgi:hypothetical protein